MGYSGVITEGIPKRPPGNTRPGIADFELRQKRSFPGAPHAPRVLEQSVPALAASGSRGRRLCRQDDVASRGDR